MQARPMCVSTCTAFAFRFSPRPYSHETVQPHISPLSDGAANE